MTDAELSARRETIKAAHVKALAEKYKAKHAFPRIEIAPLTDEQKADQALNFLARQRCRNATIGINRNRALGKTPEAPEVTQERLKRSRERLGLGPGKVTE
jgi:hypothetical protein